MKISKIIFPLMMVTTMTSCIAGEPPKAIDYDTFIAAAQEEEAKESPYTKATLKYSLRDGSPSTVPSKKGEIAFTLGEEYWVTDSEDEYADLGMEVINGKATLMDDLVTALSEDMEDIEARVTNPKSVKKKAGYFQTSSSLSLDAELAITGGKLTNDDGEFDLQRLGLAYVISWMNYGLVKSYLISEYYITKQNGEVVEDFDYEISCSVTYQK